MNIFRFKLLSKYHEVLIGDHKYYRLPQIIALRFQTSSYLIPKFIRIKNNDVIIEEREPKLFISNDNADAYFNVWLNLGKSHFPTNYLKVYFKIFGIYLKIATLNYIMIDTHDKCIYKLSDSYVDVDILSNSKISGARLENEIANMPSPIRSTLIESLRSHINSILLIRVDQLGDFILTVSAISEIRKIFPNAKITILVSPANEDIARSIGLIDEIVTIQFSFVEKTNYRTLKNEVVETIKLRFQSETFDLAIDLSPMPESRLILGIINAQRKLGIENTDTTMIDFGLLIHAKDPINTLSNVSHSVYPLLLVDAVKRMLRPDIIHIPSLELENKCLRKIGLSSKNYVIIHSGARNILVRWPLDNFINLAKKLSCPDLFIVFFADEKLNDNDKISLSKIDNCLVLDFKMPFEDFDKIISNARLFIGNDSGPKHLAALRNVPVISIHSPRTNWTEWGQINSGYVISKRVPCAGCAIITENECARELQCIKNISVEEVTQTIVEFIKSSKI